ncbi:MAG: hypothetical protein AAFW98_08770, partial [Pseudomonadota bacterium]
PHPVASAGGESLLASIATSFQTSTCFAGAVAIEIAILHHHRVSRNASNDYKLSNADDSSNSRRD